MSEGSYSMFLLGRGIGGSLTPQLHEREGREFGFSVTYRILDADVAGITEDDLGDLVTWAKRLSFTGFNVTHPFKFAIMPYLDELSDRARAIGSVNTVAIRDGKLYGHNTDWCGFQRPLLAQVPDAGNGQVVQVGAGGGGAAIAYALLDAGVNPLIIHDSDSGRATDLAQRMGALFGSDRVAVGTDLAESLAGAKGLVHCTPVGMAAHPGCAIPAELLHKELWVAEIVYFPLETELLRLARVAGCRTVDGGGMAAEQAAEAFYQFTGTRPNADRMHAELRALVAQEAATESPDEQALATADSRKVPTLLTEGHRQ